LTQGAMFCNPRTKYKRSKNVFYIQSIALSAHFCCAHICARLLHYLAPSLLVLPFPPFLSFLFWSCVDPKNFKNRKFAVYLYDLNRFFADFCDFLRTFPKNRIRHRQKTGDDLEHVPLSYVILCIRFPF